MGMVSNPSTFFIPGTTGLTPEDRDYIEKNFPDAHQTDGGVFTHEGLRTNYYVSRARTSERRIIIGFSGANAQFPLDLEHIRYLNDQGCTLICMALPRVGAHFMERSEKLVRAFLTAPMSPANILAQGSASPHFIATHSTSGPIVMKLLGEPVTGDALRSRYLGVEFLSPFFDVPHASRGHSYKTPEITVTKPVSLGSLKIPLFGEVKLPDLNFEKRSIPSTQPFSALFEWYADRKQDIPLDQRKVVKAYLALTASNEGFIEKLSAFGMTLGHVRQIQKYSKEVMARFRPDHLKGMTTLIMSGDADPCTCWKTSESMAARINPENLKDTFHKVAGGGHDLIKDKPQLLDVFLKKADQAVALREEMRKASHSIFIPAISTPQDTEKLPPLPLRDRARLAYQSGTRFLYTAASFL